MPQVLTLTLNPAVDVSTSTPLVEPAHKLRCAAPRIHPGGGGINVARVLARLGADVLALFPQGGVTGRMLRGLLDAEGVPCEGIAIAAETRESFAVHEDSSGREFRFVLPGPEMTAAELEACLLRLEALLPGTALVVASGSLPPGAPEDFYAVVARRLARHAVPLVLDTSGPALAAALRTGVHLIKPSLRELKELTGERLDDAAQRLAACRRLIERGAAHIVALSLGPEGAMLVSATEAWRARALEVPVASTIGAGDSFAGGLVWTLAAGGGLQQALRQAMATSAAALLAPGTALCEPADVARLLPRVAVEPA
jgi:6-phosphofructokinase 2